MKLAGFLLLIAVLAGCGTSSRFPKVSEEAIQAETAMQKRMALESEFERRRHLLDVVYRLARAAAPECGGGRPMAGFELGGAGLLQKAYRQAGEAIGIGETIRVTAVSADSPAARAGLKVGDRLLTLNGRAIGEGRNAYRDAGFDLVDAMAQGPVRLGVADGAGKRELSFSAEMGCPTDLFITREALPTPKANGKAVLMPVSFMRAAHRDDELAAIVAFLMAYNVRGQADSAQGGLASEQRNFIALVGEDETNLFQPPQPLDYLGVKEADRQAMVWLKRAGYSPSRALLFWRRYLAATPALDEDIRWGKSLLGAPRLVRMREAAELVEQ